MENIDKEKRQIKELGSRTGTKPDISDLGNDIEEEHVPEININSFSGYFDEIEKLVKKGFTFFRGDKYHSGFELVPKLFKSENKKFISHQDKMINDFTSLTVGKHPNQTLGIFEEMLNAQHYEIPTRLLDWSESAIVALYFAVYKIEKEENKDAVVWALNPEIINSHVSFIHDSKHVGPIYVSASFQSHDEDLKKYYQNRNLKEPYPVAVKTRKINPRIDSQRGVFLVFSEISDTKCLTKYKDSCKFLCKINIPKDIAKLMHKQLESAGITQYTLFPELHSIADDIKANYGG